MATGGQINTDILSDEIVDVLCSMCKNKGKNSEGEKFCVDCHDYFCANCVQVHNQVPVLAGHKVLDKSPVMSGTSLRLPKAPAERCHRHSHKHIDMYCKNHDNVGCSTCMDIDHRSCKDILYIPEFIQNSSYLVDSNEVQRKLKTIAKRLTVQVDKYNQGKQRLLNRKAGYRNAIKKFRQEINDQLDKLEKCSVDELEDKVKLLEGRIEESLKQLQIHKAKVISVDNKLESQNQNQAEVFVYMKMGEEAGNLANKCIEEVTMNNKMIDINFQPDRKLLHQLQQYKNIGMLTEKISKTVDTLFKITGSKSYPVKVDSDKESCSIISACYMEDGSIILADQYNKKLKRLECSNYTITDCYDVQERPGEICKINTTQIAVTLTYIKKVLFISLEEQMKTTNNIKTEFYCYGIAYAKNLLYISDRETSVYIYTLYGQKLKQFIIDQSGQEMRHNINSLAVSTDATRIYVAHETNGLIVLDNNGQVVTKFNSEQLQCATSCHFTEAGTLLVSGSSRFASKYVLQFTSDGELMGEVLKLGIFYFYIQSVCCNQEMSKMYINRIGKDNIKVYDI